MEKKSPWEIRQKFIYLKCKSMRKKKQEKLEKESPVEQKQPVFRVIKKDINLKTKEDEK